MLLLTDGLENTAPCLEAGCQWGNPGGEIDYATLDLTQACAVGLGNAASINGELLTIFAERQGGIYLNNTDSTGDDLKDFFTKCFAELTDEFVGLDPAGTMAASDPAGPIVPFESCDDKRLTFTAGWNRSSLAGDHLQFLVTTPAGNVWAPVAGYGEQSTQPSWAFKRCPLPYGIESGQGVWNMQLLRPQRTFVNGFTSDAFADLGQGVRLVRRQIQRLCPVDDQGRRSCQRVLFFEDGLKGSSAYAAALRQEQGSTVGEIGEARSADELERRLREASWDLVVYAHQAGADQREVYDGRLAEAVCRGTRAILTDTRSVPEAAGLLRCAGAARSGGTNLKTLQGGERFLPEVAQLANPGYAIFSYGLASAGEQRRRQRARRRFLRRLRLRRDRRPGAGRRADQLAQKRAGHRALQAHRLPAPHRAAHRRPAGDRGAHPAALQPVGRLSRRQDDGRGRTADGGAGQPGQADRQGRAGRRRPDRRARGAARQDPHSHPEGHLHADR